ncbi:uncharacterized protein TNCV_3391601 [Trichonephila clavipes]|nr:uncharacterized protein TNCV_3391601 [Trichonephila clavipes]
MMPVPLDGKCFRYVSWFKTCSTFSPYRYPPRITTQTKPGLITEHLIGPLSHTPMLMFQTPVHTSAFMRRREGNANCWSSGIQASMIESPVNSLSRYSYSCGDWSAEPSALAVLPLLRRAFITRYRSWRGVVTLDQPDTGCRVTSPVL